MKPSLAPDTGIELQKIGTADLDDLAGRCRELFHCETWHAAAVERTLATPGSFALLARTPRRAAGLILARVAAEECEILWLVVPAPWRRRGIGRRLLRAALRSAAGHSAGTAFLEVSQDNRAALALYGSEGFRPCGRRRAYYGGGRQGNACDALVYKKALASGETCPAN